MQRLEFDKLKLSEQVEYINEKLSDGKTLTEICKEIGIGRTTIRDRFKNIGYEYNKATKQYESFVEIVDSEMGNMDVEGKYVQGSSKKVVESVIVNNKVLEDLILNYTDMNDKLNELYTWYQKSSEKVVIDDKKLTISDFKGKVVTRSYKLYEEVQKEFADFCKINNKYKVQDILCQFILEGLEKYK